MNHIRIKFILIILFSILLPAAPSYFLVRSLVEQGLEIGLNKNVETALENATDISQQLYTKYKQETISYITRLSQSREFLNQLGRKKLVQSIKDQAEQYSVHNFVVYDRKFDIISQYSFAENDSTQHPSPGPSDLETIFIENRPGFYNVSNPLYIIAYAPVNINNSPALLLTTRLLPKHFAQSARHIVEVNQMFKRLDFISSDIKKSLILTFLAVYIPITILSLIVGYYFSRKITSPLLELVKGTQIVAAGNWEYRVKSGPKDEIGQLIEAFNDMVSTLKQKHREVLEQEERRLRMEEENLRKTRILEVSRLKSKALVEENKRKSIELEKAQELEKAYKALEESHRELHNTQAQLIQSGKMASLGNLVAGIAHEINNPLGAINSAADVSHRAVQILLENMSGPNEKTYQPLEILQNNTQLILEASSRVVKIIKSLKTFARLDEADFKTTDIHEGLDSTLMLLHHESKNRIEIIKNYGNVPPVPCYPNELNQIFMNILANAIQAIKENGKITVQTDSDGYWAHIKITDTGKGITQENLSKIFDPGFTTKGVGVGTGLGLSISYNIIQKHNGRILVDSETGKGTTFTIDLPLQNTKK